MQGLVINDTIMESASPLQSHWQQTVEFLSGTYSLPPFQYQAISNRQRNSYLELTLYPPFNIRLLLLRNEIPLTARAPENHGDMIDF